MLIGREAERLALLLRNRHRHDLAFEEPCSVRARIALLAAQRELVLIGACDAVLLRHVLRSLRHRVDAVLRLHQRIDEAPADCRVFDLRAPRESAVGLAHDERRSRHALHAASDHQLRFAGANCPRGKIDGVET
jgi:hypothetical protein